MARRLPPDWLAEMTLDLLGEWGVRASGGRSGFGFRISGFPGVAGVWFFCWRFHPGYATEDS